jgi:hypothetical protein
MSKLLCPYHARTGTSGERCANVPIIFDKLCENYPCVIISQNEHYTLNTVNNKIMCEIALYKKWYNELRQNLLHLKLSNKQLRDTLKIFADIYDSKMSELYYQNVPNGLFLQAKEALKGE